MNWCELQMSEMAVEVEVKMFKGVTNKHRVTCRWRLLLCKASEATYATYALTQLRHLHLHM